MVNDSPTPLTDIRAMFDPVGVFTFTVDAGSAIPAELGHVLVGDSMVSRLKGPPHRMVRSAEQAADGREFVSLAYTRVGHAVVRQDGRTSDNDPGSLVLYRTDAPFSYVVDRPCDLAGFVTHRSHLSRPAQRLLRHATGVSLPPSSTGAAAIALMDQIHASEGTPRRADGLLLERSLIAIVETLITEFADLPAVEGGKAHLAQARELIDARFADPAFTPATLAKALGIGTRRLHRLFEAEPETAAAALRTRRLQGVAARLADTDDSASLAEIADQNGFSDRDQAARAFKTAYGVTMGEFRRTARP